MGENLTRQKIVVEADKLFYIRGYEYTSLADIALAVKISRGNFYHHFKTKDEILSAVITLRFERTKEILDLWEQKANTPIACIQSFINILIMNQIKIKQYGCPVGSLCMELVKLNSSSLPQANEIFILFKTWLAKQFSLLGKKANADSLAMHLLARSQGIAVMASTIGDEKFLSQEVDLLLKWLNDRISSD